MIKQKFKHICQYLSIHERKKKKEEGGEKNAKIILHEAQSPA